MDDSVTLLNLILMAIAVGIFIKLRSVLGRRTGNERPPFDPYSASEEARDNDKVVVLAPRKREQPDVEAAEGDTFGAYPNRPPYVVEDTTEERIGKAPASLKQILTEIAIADRQFELDGFMSGARMAYEMIVTAYAAGDRRKLEPLLSADVFKSFEAAIGEREKLAQTIEQSFIGINRAELVDARLSGHIARLTIKFVSELTSATKNAEGAVISGDPVTVRTVTDYWTFERDVKSRDPNWRLVATGSDN